MEIWMSKRMESGPASHQRAQEPSMAATRKMDWEETKHLCQLAEGESEHMGFAHPAPLSTSRAGPAAGPCPQASVGWGSDSGQCSCVGLHSSIIIPLSTLPSCKSSVQAFHALHLWPPLTTALICISFLLHKHSSQSQAQSWPACTLNPQPSTHWILFTKLSSLELVVPCFSDIARSRQPSCHSSPLWVLRSRWKQQNTYA